MSREIFWNWKLSVESAIPTQSCLLSFLGSQRKIAEQGWIWMMLAAVLSWDLTGHGITSMLRAINNCCWPQFGLGWTMLFPDNRPRLVRLWGKKRPFSYVSPRDFHVVGHRRGGGGADINSAVRCWLLEHFRQGAVMAATGWEQYHVALSSISVDLWIEFPKWMILQLSQVKTKMQLNFMSFIHPFPLCRR